MVSRMERKFLVTIVICLSVGLALTVLEVAAQEYIFTEDFSSGNFSAWSTSPGDIANQTFSINSQTTYNGAEYSAENSLVGGPNSGYWPPASIDALYYHTLSSVPNPIYMREYVYLNSSAVPSTNGDYYEIGGFCSTIGGNYGDGEICVINVQGTLYLGIYYLSSYSSWPFSCSISSDNQTSDAHPLSSLSPGWHSVELEDYIGNSTTLGEEQLFLDGQTIINVYTNNTARTVSGVVIGGSYSTAKTSERWNYYIDDVAVSSSPIGVAPNKLTTSTNYGSVSPSGGSYDSGSTVVITATSPPNNATDKYIWDGWTGSGTGSYSGLNNPATITMDGPITETATWGLQCYLTVTSTYGSPSPSSGWFFSGSSITESVASPVSAGSGTGTQYACTGWTGTGSVPATGSASAVTFTITAPSTIAWNWETQYYLTVTSPYGTTLGTGWYDSGTSTYATVTSLTVAGTTGTQYVFTSWSGGASGTTSPSNPILMNGPKTAIANWQTQYYMTVSSSYGAPTGQGWYNAASSASFSVTTPASGGTGIQYVFTSWTGSGSGSYSGTSSSQSVTMNNVITETASWQTQYQVTFTQTGVGSDFSGNVITVNGTTYNSAGFKVWSNPGVVYTFRYASPLVVTASGEQYVLTAVSGNGTVSSLTVSEAATVTGAYKTQYYLTVTSAQGSPSPSSGWFDSGSSISAYVGSPISVSAGEQYVCSGWTGSGSTPTSGTTSTTTFTISAPSTVTWNWETQYYLTVTSTYGTAGGAGWYNSGSSAYVTVTPTTVPVGSGSTATFTGWSGDASGTTSPSNAIIMNDPKTATATWTVSTAAITTPTPKPTPSVPPSPSPSPTLSPSPTTSPSRSPSPALNVGTYAIIGVVVAVILVAVIAAVIFLRARKNSSNQPIIQIAKYVR